MTNQPDLILGTAGHIDHGKSSLVKALTGTDPDRLEEEKRRGITIELGFAHLELPDGTQMGVVDVPGHERFVRQMISGSTGVDLALLCIAADDGIMPQTTEHLAVLQLLAIKDCVVAITKSDLVDEDWLSLISEEIRNRLASTPYAEAAIIPTSSRTGDGLDSLKSALAQAANQRKVRRSSVMRLPVDRVFTVKGSGTVITGTLWSGTVALDDEIEILPSKTLARVRSVQVHGKATEEAYSGNRVALNLGGVSTEEVRPGDFLTTPGSIQPTNHFDAYFSYLDSTQSAKALESGTRIHLAHGTREVLGRILFINSTEALKPGEDAFVQIRLEEDLPLSRKDRFIIRSYSPVAVIGGGSVLRSHPRRRTKLSKEEFSLLEALEKDDENEIIRKAAALKKAPFTEATISRECEIDKATVLEVLAELVKEATLIPLEAQSGQTWYLSPKVEKSALTKMENILIRYHGDNPDQAGISKNALLQRFEKNIDPAAFDVLISEAQKQGKLSVDGGIIAHPKAGAHLKQAEASAGQHLLTLLKDSQTTPPLTQDLIKQSGLDGGVAQRALNTLEKEGLAVRVSKDLYFEKTAFEGLLTKAKSYLKEQGRAQAADLKDAMGLSRKYAIPLLEYFDSIRVTRREGDSRVLIE